jgi:hypothetical protein
VIPLELKFFSLDCFKFPNMRLKPVISLPLLPKVSTPVYHRFATTFNTFFISCHQIATGFATKYPQISDLKTLSALP